MIERISQSFICDMRDYLGGDYCGNLLRAKYVDGRLLDDQTDSMNEGSYFEFCVSGAIPKNGKIPQPEYMISALKRNGGKIDGLTDKDMYEEYRKAKSDAKKILEYMDRMGLKMVSVGKTLTKGRFVGTLDLIVECTKTLSFVIQGESYVWEPGQRLIIDLKRSGLLYNRWEKFGWAWSNIQKEFHGTQAKQYHFIGGGLPFLFWVTQPPTREGDEPDMKLFMVPITEGMIEDHINEGNKLYDEFVFHVEKMGLVPRPSLKKCLKCVLNETCKDKHDYPHPEIVDLNFDRSNGVR